METNTVLDPDTRAYCSECGGSFSTDDMIRHGGAFVCAKCKPVFMQKLAEGALLSTGKLRYAGFWRRWGAILIDGVGTSLVLVIIEAVFMNLTVWQVFGFAQRPLTTIVLQQVIGFVVGAVYETFFIGRFGATLGKMAFKIHVVTPEGNRISYLRALARHLAKIISGVILLIGYLMAAFDVEGRALHDRICNTRVVME